jgi:hypothetical protein
MPSGNFFSLSNFCHARCALAHLCEQKSEKYQCSTSQAEISSQGAASKSAKAKEGYSQIVRRV